MESKLLRDFHATPYLIIVGLMVYFMHLESFLLMARSILHLISLATIGRSIVIILDYAIVIV